MHLMRTAPLQDGSVLSDYVSVVYPSLYTHYRYGYVDICQRGHCGRGL